LRRTEEPGQADRRAARAGNGRRRALSLTSATEAGAFAPASPTFPKRQGQRKADWRRRRTVLAFMSPWILGFSVFFGYPLVMTVYLSFQHYDLLSSPKSIGFANYQYLLGGIPWINHLVTYNGTGDPLI